MPTALHGVYAPVLTPFDEKLEPDTRRFIGHCQWLLRSGVGLAIFGTNSEAASLSMAERIGLIESLLAAGIPSSRLMPGTGSCALPEAVVLTRHAVECGAPGVLMLPPFYFKNVTDDGVFAYYAEVIERVGSDRLGVYLYHFPQMSQVPITPGVIERLLARYPKTVLGMKDSSGDWANSKAMIERHAASGFAVFPASESLLSKALAIGGAGCISATVNVNPAAIQAVYERWKSSQGEALQAKVDVIRKIFAANTPMIAAMKHVIGEMRSDPAWRIVRPPLRALDTSAAEKLMGELRAAGFAMRE